MKPRIFLFLGIVSLLFGTGSCSKTYNNIEHHDLVDTILQKAWLLRDSGYIDESLHFLDSSFRTISEPGLEDRYRRYDFKINLFTYNTRNYPAASRQVDSLLGLMQGQTKPDNADPKKYRSMYAMAYIYKGDIFFEQKRYPEAYRYYFTGNKLAINHSDLLSCGEYFLRLATVCFKQSKYVEAAGFYRSAYDLFTKAEVNYVTFCRRQEFLDDIGICYARAGLNDSALIYFNRALSVLASGKITYVKEKAFLNIANAIVYGNMADAYINKKQYLRAEDLLDKSIRYNLHTVNYGVSDAEYSMAKLADVYLKQNKTDEAGEVLDQMAVALDKVPNKAAELRYYRIRRKVAELKGRQDEAYQMVLKYLDLKDSLDENEKKLTSADFKAEFKNLEQDFELGEMRLKDEQKSRYLWLTICMSGMALAIIYLIYRYYRQSRENVQGLTGLNGQISSQNAILRSTLESLEQSRAEKAKLLKIVAHDLRSPIGAIRSAADLLIDELDCDAENMELLEMIRESGNNSLELISQLLNDGKGADEHIVKEPADLSSLLQYCTDLLKHQAEQKLQRITLQTIPAQVSLNREKMWRVFSNLITNAIKFSPAGGQIDLRVTKASGNVTVSVADRGIGIPEELKSRIFEDAGGAGRMGTSSEESFGLGLSICRQIVTAHGGKIWFESEVGRGTTFFVQLPMQLSA
ncbi:MAG: ATP-binding protein [Bacteroidota bacterium]